MSETDGGKYGLDDDETLEAPEEGPGESSYSMEEILGSDFMEAHGDVIDRFDQKYSEDTDAIEDVQEEIQELAESAHEDTMASQELLDSLKALGAEGDVEEAVSGIKGKLKSKANSIGSKLPDWVPGSGKLEDMGKVPTLAIQLKLRYNQLEDQHEYIEERAEAMYGQIEEWSRLRDEFADARIEALEQKREVEEQLVGLNEEYEELEEQYEEADDELEQARLEQEMDELDDERRKRRKELQKVSLAANRLANMYESSGTMIETQERVVETAEQIYEDMDDAMDQMYHVMNGGAQLGKTVEHLAETTKHFQGSKELLNEAVRRYSDAAKEVQRNRVVFHEGIIDEETREYLDEQVEEMDEIDEEQTAYALAKDRDESPEPEQE